MIWRETWEKKSKESCTLEHKCCASLLWESVYSPLCSQKALESSWIQRAICLYYFTYSFTTRTGCSCISCGPSEAHSMTAQQRGAVPLSQDGCLQMKGENAFLSVFSSQISRRNEQKYNTGFLVTACLHFKNTYMFYLLFKMYNVYSTKECVRTYVGMIMW